MSKLRIGIALGVVSLISAVWIASAQAQVQGVEWSQPFQLSSGAGKASEAYCAADHYGYAHCLWTETLYADGRTIIQYARFDGETWTTPNAIYVTGQGIENVSPFVDQQGTLHLAWAEGLRGPIYYTHAPANDAISARSWAPPVRINVPGRTLRLRVDSKGVIHILYIEQVDDRGVFYVRSKDQGVTWSEPVRLDPDILPDHVPDGLNFEIDDADGLHAVWFYGALEQDGQPDWVRYAHSLDGGVSWSAPFLIDSYNAESNHLLTSASPVMIVQGQTVHVIWAAGQQPYRNHRFSTDAGRTWSAPRQIFGELQGQAFDGLAVDGAGRVHFVGQIRYPIGIYHAYWDQQGWTLPSLVYLIGLEGEGIGDRIHAHHTHLVVRAGNQLVLTFADPPADANRRLFEMHLTLEDIPPLEAVPTPTPPATRIPSPSSTPRPPTPLPTPTSTVPIFSTTTGPRESGLQSDHTLRAAMVPTLLLLVGMLVIRLFAKIRL